MTTQWRCPHCLALNGSAIYRCNSCGRWRSAETETVVSNGPSERLTAEERSYIGRMRSTTPMRAAWLYLRWERIPKPYGRAAVIPVAAMALTLLLAAETDMAWSLIGVVAGLSFLVPVATIIGSTPYRSDRPFRLALVALDEATVLGFAAAFIGAASLLPRSGGQPIFSAVVHTVAPSVDVDSIVVGIVGTCCVALWVIGILGQRARSRSATAESDALGVP
jgi:hypothetical protein